MSDREPKPRAEPQPEPDPFEPEPDPFEPEPDPFEPEPDPFEPEPDPFEPEPDPFEPEPTDPGTDPDQEPVDPLDPADPIDPIADPQHASPVDAEELTPAIERIDQAIDDLVKNIVHVAGAFPDLREPNNRGKQRVPPEENVALSDLWRHFRANYEADCRFKGQGSVARQLLEHFKKHSELETLLDRWVESAFSENGPGDIDESIEIAKNLASELKDSVKMIMGFYEAHYEIDAKRKNTMENAATVLAGSLTEIALIVEAQLKELAKKGSLKAEGKTDCVVWLFENTFNEKKNSVQKEIEKLAEKIQTAKDNIVNDKANFDAADKKCREAEEVRDSKRKSQINKFIKEHKINNLDTYITKMRNLRSRNETKYSRSKEVIDDSPGKLREFNNQLKAFDGRNRTLASIVNKQHEEFGDYWSKIKSNGIDNIKSKKLYSDRKDFDKLAKMFDQDFKSKVNGSMRHLMNDPANLDKYRKELGDTSEAINFYKRIVYKIQGECNGKALQYTTPMIEALDAIAYGLAEQVSYFSKLNAR